MFGYNSDDGFGSYLISRTVDDAVEIFNTIRESHRLDEVDQLHARYRRLLAYAQRIEGDLEERNRQLAATQNDLAVRTQQLEAAQNELKAVYARNAFEASERRLTMIILQDRERERARQRLAGSQPE